jgi:DNA topoisomerase-1
MSIDPVLAKELKKAELRYVSHESPGFTRLRRGEKFTYYDKEGTRITDKEVIERIESLGIPPAWSNVWVCPYPTGYLQAVGYDEKKRKQYIYHPDWVALSQENKFNKLEFFGEALPRIRSKISRDIAREELEREKIIATVIWLLEHTFIRIGNTEYAEENNSYGLTTLRNRHVTVRGKQVTFDFRGKSGVEQSIQISHPRIVKVIKECIELPGYEIFKYVDDDGQKYAVDSADVNEYLKLITEKDITAKDFRTWGGTVLCATHLHTLGGFETETQGKRNVSESVKKVASHLHNTPTVSRNYYIHPVVIETYHKNLLIPHFEHIYKTYDREKAKLPREEFATLTLIQKYS